MDKQERDSVFIGYLLDKQCMSRAFQSGAETFCSNLIGDYDKVAEIFNTSQRKYLEVFEYVFSNNLNGEIDPLEFVNKNLIENNLGGWKISSAELDLSPLHSNDTDDDKINLNEKETREKAFRMIINHSCSEARVLAHFLVEYTIITKVYINKSTVQERLKDILDEWWSTDKFPRSWSYLKAVLKLLHKERLIKEIERDNGKQIQVKDCNIDMVDNAVSGKRKRKMECSTDESGEQKKRRGSEKLELMGKIRNYKNNLMESLHEKQVQLAVNGADGSPTYQTMDMQQSYVELAITNQIHVDKSWLISDRDYHMHQMVSQKESIKIQDILTADDKFVVVNGIAGIGKSTLLEMLVYQWSKGKMFNGSHENSPDIKLLLLMRCRDLNWLDIDVKSSTEEILKLIFPKLFKNIDMNQLEELSQHILIVIDGIDELRGIAGIVNRSRNMEPIAKFIYTLIEPSQTGFLYGKTVILAGRPEVCVNIRKLFEQSIKIKKVEVCGFNSDGVKAYIRKHVPEGQYELLMRKIQKSNIIYSMVHVPVYAWVITGLYRENDSIISPKTTTELLLYACLIFIRKHFRKQDMNLKELSLEEICDNPTVLKHLLLLSEFSHKTLQEKKVLFPHKECGDLDLEETGFVVKGRTGEREVYQFRHLVMQELFCALYVFLNENPSKQLGFYTEGNINGCLPIVAGLEGILKGEGGALLKNMLNNLIKEKSIQEPFSVMRLVEEKIHSDGNLSFFMENPMYLNILFEFHQPLSERLMTYFQRNNLFAMFPETEMVDEWMAYLIGQFCALKPRRPLFLCIGKERLADNVALKLSKCVANIAMLKIWDLQLHASDLIMQNLGEYLMSARESILFRRLDLQHVRKKSDITTVTNLSRVVPFASHIEIQSHLLEAVSSSVQERVESGRSIKVNHLTVHNDDTNPKTASFWTVFRCFRSVTLHGFSTKFLKTLFNPSQLKEMKTEKLRISNCLTHQDQNVYMSDLDFQQQLYSLRAFKTIEIFDITTPQSSIDVLKKKILESKIPNVTHKMVEAGGWELVIKSSES